MFHRHYHHAAPRQDGLRRAIGIRQTWGACKKIPPPAKEARLDKYKHHDPWCIFDTDRLPKSTSCTDRAEAEKVLGAYIATKGKSGAANEPANVTCGEVLAIYDEEYAPTVAAPVRTGCAMAALLPFWGELILSCVKGHTCRRYGKWRGKSDGMMAGEHVKAPGAVYHRDALQRHA